jgi:K+ transporter
LVFIASNSFKFFDGGWFPLGLSIVMVLTMVIGYQRYGKQKLKAALNEFNSKEVKE